MAVTGYCVKCKKKQEQITQERANKTLKQIIFEDKKSVQYAYGEIEKYEIKTGRFDGRMNSVQNIMTKPVNIWVQEKKVTILLPEEEQKKATEILESKCPGKKK